MFMLIVVAVLIALMGFAISRHWKVREDKSVKNPRRHLRRRCSLFPRFACAATADAARHITYTSPPLFSILHALQARWQNEDYGSLCGRRAFLRMKVTR
ncbi:hypothetical protein [Candidatus Pantoea persica]|nr:hypothetical protein [Candidatus Pantoea persica]MBA2816782.1 hydroxymethylbilane synthase [Candidatus Pantoea persica]